MPSSSIFWYVDPMNHVLSLPTVANPCRAVEEHLARVVTGNWPRTSTTKTH